ncbi:hypothetical protein XU18_3834 [Perkinsela sp. CCAP 1560/4]|nr:hypothetical protein XU18_3834 [Perkinsela sp. CCAP 1560/4]|eukprot:KNH05059.1 hypothetical protein XU18_3834 [Perkinsela sp. CCAP 1560/4]
MVNRIVNSPITLYEKIKLSSCDLQLSSKHGELTALNSQQSGWCDYHNSSLECKQIELEQVGWACMQDFSNSSSIANSETIITWSNSPDDHEKRMTKLKNAIYDQLDKFLNSESAGDNLLVREGLLIPNEVEYFAMDIFYSRLSSFEGRISCLQRFSCSLLRE